MQIKYSSRTSSLITTQAPIAEFRISGNQEPLYFTFKFRESRCHVTTQNKIRDRDILGIQDGKRRVETLETFGKVLEVIITMKLQPISKINKQFEW